MTDKIIFQGSVRAGKTAAIIATLTAERDRYKEERDELINCGGNIIAKCERCCNDRHCLTCHLVQDWEHLINRIREKP